MKDGHWGLLGITEKVDSLQGTIHMVESGGTRITILI
jgi:glucose-6-phosphate-specific signal transduction histidine kinase